MIGTAALLLCVLALGDQRSSSLPDGLQPVLVGAAVLVIGISMGSNSGYAINPARDLGPRLFTYIAGWGVDVFKLVLSLRASPSSFVSTVKAFTGFLVCCSTLMSVCLCRAGGGWWWVPIVAPCVGALLGTLIYELMIEVHHPVALTELQTSCQEASDTKMELEGVEPVCQKKTAL